MKIFTEEDIITIIQEDPWMMDILKEVQKLNLPDYWIGAGFVRSKVWDYLHGYTKRTPIPDIDVIYFDKRNTSVKSEKAIQKQLVKRMQDIHWEVVNQARMHTFHHDKPYTSSSEALSRWVETATCIGVKLNKKNHLELTAPIGIEDLVHLIVRQNPTIEQDDSLFLKRVSEKRWKQLWPKLTIRSNI